MAGSRGHDDLSDGVDDIADDDDHDDLDDHENVGEDDEDKMPEEQIMMYARADSPGGC